MKFSDIPRISQANYRVDVPWYHLRRHLEMMADGGKLELDPPYQRGYVWTLEQKIAYIEFRLKGGMSGGDIFWNAPGWNDATSDTVELVDGKQRLNAVLEFLDGKFPAFGLMIHEFKGDLDMVRYRFKFHINDLKDPADVLQWYIDMNTGGSIHTEDDLAPAYKLLAEVKKSMAVGRVK